MQLLVRRLGLLKPTNANANANTRSFATRSSRIISKQLLSVIKLIKKRSPNPLWTFLAGGIPRRGVKLVSTLKENGIAVADYERWDPVLRARNFSSAATLLPCQGEEAHQAGNTRLPPWVLLTLCFKARSPSEAHQAASLAITYLPHVASELRPAYLIIIAHMLATYGVLPSLERVIRLFIGLPLYDESWYFNLLLRTLSHFSVSQDSDRFMAQLSIIILNAMTARGLSLTSGTYLILLENRYIALELTEVLRQRMVREGITPDQKHLEAFLRIFAHRGTIHDATGYAETIRCFVKSKTSPHISGDATNEALSNSSAIQYLTHLVHEGQWKKTVGAEADWRTHRSGGGSSRLVSKRVVDSPSWMARLHSLSNTHSMTARSLLAFFDWSTSQNYPFRTETTMTYTILLKGLLRKGASSLALQVWDRYRNTTLRLDRASLSVGLEVLTYAGHPEQALQLLEAVYVDSRGSRLPGQPTPTKREVLTAKGTVPTSILNPFMLALCKTGRPNAVLSLWEHMERLYGTKPDATSLAYMLKAAREASYEFQSISGAFKELGLRNPFYREPVSEEDRWASRDCARQQALLEINKILTSDIKGSDMWDGVVAWRRAREIFQHILFGNWPTLANVEPPAQALRASESDVAESPFRDLKRFLVPAVAALPTPAQAGPKLSIISPYILRNYGIHPLGKHPQIFPTDHTFRAFILLLGTQRQAADIPLALAWMRALELTPTTPTLALSLVFWAEVSVNAPLLEAWRGTEERSEYARLVRWLRGWVGHEALPSDQDVGAAMRVVNSLRGQRHS